MNENSASSTGAAHTGTSPERAEQQGRSVTESGTSAGPGDQDLAGQVSAGSFGDTPAVDQRSSDAESLSTHDPTGQRTPGTDGAVSTFSGDRDASVDGDNDRSGDNRDPEQTLLEQMGGVSGLAYSAVPIIVFVVINSLAGLMPAIWGAIGVAVAITVIRLVRREPMQPAISGVLGVAVCSFIAYRSGDAKGFFLLGIWTSLIYGGVFLGSVLVRWPLVGVAWSVLNGQRNTWRHHRRAVLGYDVATLCWTVVFAAKYVVQQWLYDSDQTGWLAVARIAMGYPLTGLALIVTVWAIRRAAKVAEEATSGAVDDMASGSDAAPPR